MSNLTDEIDLLAAGYRDLARECDLLADDYQADAAQHRKRHLRWLWRKSSQCELCEARVAAARSRHALADVLRGAAGGPVALGRANVAAANRLVIETERRLRVAMRA